MTDTTIFDATVPTDGTLANAHENILRMKRGGVYESILGDGNNFNPVPTPITQARENYGQHGRPSIEKIGDSWIVSWTTEVVRNPVTKQIAIAQAWLVDLLHIANKTGRDNKADFQWFDAFDVSLPAHEGTFSVAAVPQNTGYADKAGWTITLTSDGIVDDIASPLDNAGQPIVESIPTAAGAIAGKNIVLRGYNLDTVTAATIGGVAATSITKVPGDSRILVLEVPAGSAGSVPVVVTNPQGASTAVNYTRGA